jgi:hypothetical protein
LFSVHSPNAQTIDPKPAIELQFYCPKYPVCGFQPLTLNADILGTEDAEVLKPMIFRWTTSTGTIEKGQGTSKITLSNLKNPPSRVNSVTVNITVDGGPPELGNEKSCVMRIDSMCSVTPRVDQFGDISFDEESQHLDRFANLLKVSAPESIGFVVSYAGKNACLYEAKWRLDRARKYLEEKHYIRANRIVAVEGGYRNRWSIELFIQPNADCGPLPTPTLQRVQAHVQGRCGI